ncbi:hypothetical protein [Glycomyces terrestris]|uniref:Uncharacterized protein n=1 Tax=Glycomyces terrestris TaxID=2493553 RepID=A0A426USZ1_9ACTN|nr:hypothetical protein [Glycomyces terrestris]RRR96829.1 hypothetical protein EIW28_20500 [Glycomyces terrestris]
MRRRALALAAAAAVTIGVTGFAASAAADTHVTDAPKVANTWGPGGELHYDVEPTNLVLSEYTTGLGIEWTSWGPDQAVGTGDLHGVWIDGGVYEDVTITLYNVENGYFTEFQVTGDFPQPEHPEDLIHGYFPVV